MQPPLALKCGFTDIVDIGYSEKLNLDSFTSVVSGHIHTVFMEPI